MSSSPKKRDHAHDRLFRFSFSRVVHARGALRALVGPDLARQLDWSSLRLEPGSYVEEALRGSMSDLLFSVRFTGSERKALAYLLWEHMHSAFRLMPLRMVNYGGQALRDYMQRTGALDGYLPVLVPVVIVQSGQWPGPRQLSELHVLPGEPRPRVYMDLEMIVHELRDDSLPAAELTTLARTTLRLLRLAVQQGLVAANAERIARWLAQVHRAHGYDDFRALLEYIARTASEDGVMQAIIEHSDEDLAPEAMSIADKLEARGKVLGRAEGKHLGRAEMLLEQLEHRFGRLPSGVEAKALGATVPQLEAWALRLLDVATLDAVFEER